MRKPGLTEWAVIGGLIASVGFVVSLLFVANSVNRNIDVQQASTENLIFELHAQLANQVLADPSFARILFKMRSFRPELDQIEAIRWEKYQMGLLDIWSMAYRRHQVQLLSDEQWKAWDEYFTVLFTDGGEKLSRLRWEQLQSAYDDGFWTHVEQAVFKY